MIAMINDTICSPATHPINSSIAVIRMSGTDSLRILSSVFSRPAVLVPRYAVFGAIRDGEMPVDDVVAVFYREPGSFTGEDMVEVSCHGNPIIVKNIIDLFIRHGARLAQAGEFSKRAFLNGKMDLTAAEAVNHIVRARGEWEIRAALEQMHGSLRGKIGSIRERLIAIKADIECGIDFSEEEIEFISRTEAATRMEEIRTDLEDILRRCRVGEKISQGIDLPIIGKPNVGKSSILNLILNSERAIVSDLPGTTRDLIRETVHFGGIHVNLYDTAGIDTPGCEIEEKGIEFSWRKISDASMIVLVFDSVTGLTDADIALLDKTEDKPRFTLANKIDLVSPEQRESRLLEMEVRTGSPLIPFSARTGEGLDRLEKEAGERLRNEYTEYKNFYISDMRMQKLLETSLELSAGTKNLIERNEPPEITAFELQSLIDSLSEITGEISPDDVLDSIFSRFCIGK